MNVLELFAGIGGLGLGLERAGMTVVGQVEIDEFCQRVLAKHWPEVPRHDDVRSCVEWWRSERRPPVHVVAGGFPCQPVSSAGHRKGSDDARWLWPEFAMVVRQLRPAFVLLENVTALLERGFGDVLGDLAASGYDAEWDCIPAAVIGAPHQRDRVFAVAYPAGERQEEIFAAGREPSSRLLAEAKKNWGGNSRRGASGRVRLLPDSDDVGVDDGFPSELDMARLHALGNSVVPQVSEYIGRLILSAEGRAA